MSRVSDRASTKSPLRLQAQRQTKRALRIGRRDGARIHVVFGEPAAANGGSKFAGGTSVAVEPLPNAYAFVNSSKRTMVIVAFSEEEARAKAVEGGLVRKPENAKLVAVNP